MHRPNRLHRSRRSARTQPRLRVKALRVLLQRAGLFPWRGWRARRLCHLCRQFRARRLRRQRLLRRPNHLHRSRRFARTQTRSCGKALRVLLQRAGLYPWQGWRLCRLCRQHLLRRLSHLRLMRRPNHSRRCVQMPRRTKSCCSARFCAAAPFERTLTELCKIRQSPNLQAPHTAPRSPRSPSLPREPRAAQARTCRLCCAKLCSKYSPHLPHAAPP